MSKYRDDYQALELRASRDGERLEEVETELAELEESSAARAEADARRIERLEEENRWLRGGPKRDRHERRDRAQPSRRSPSQTSPTRSVVWPAAILTCISLVFAWLTHSHPLMGFPAALSLFAALWTLVGMWARCPKCKTRLDLNETNQLRNDGECPSCHAHFE